MFRNTEIYKIALRARKLSEAEMWFDAFHRDSVLQETLLERIKTRLRQKGTDNEGPVIGYYSLLTSLINPKKEFNTPYTLEDTGEFFESMFVAWFPTYILVDGDGDKGDDNLFEKYGDGIIGPDEADREWLYLALRVKFVDYVKRVLFGY